MVTTMHLILRHNKLSKIRQLAAGMITDDLQLIRFLAYKLFI